MRWHRNPFFHTAVLPPSVAPSARQSTDLDGATAAAAAANRAAVLADDVEAIAATGPQATSSAVANVDSTPQGLLAEAAKLAVEQTHHPRLSFLARRHHEPSIPRLTILEPSDHLTPYQFFYIFIIDGMGAFILSGAINFAIAYAMYKTINSDKHPIRLFQFPNTIAGDAALTVFIQCVITWFIELILVNRDIRSGHIQPIGFIPEPANALLRWFLLLDRLPATGSSGSGNNGETSGSGSGNASGGDDEIFRPLSAPHDANCRCDKHVEPYEPGSLKHWMFFLVSQLIRALMLGVLAFLLVWGPAIGIMTAVGDHHNGDWWFDSSSWAPPIFKLIYGGVLALLTTPLFVIFWLVRCGWALQANQRHLDEVS
ncbi:hypothetical protein CMQ_3319 [Grosmannia clavigera kw1407]|uniref:Uncharacterized protein n=1 Tax=Grosmannia clavigera (strain kw1407 / UAMH 11150) TaxID=655863 RepID=F0X9M0_GROCL|nr:uncharacterized protein CMQ_3319 [Grosmannia clavigera kw1407]EFX05250.1 hypothetical protein CMQ_3319 [Grosmannia clavigera kw1407]